MLSMKYGTVTQMGLFNNAVDEREIVQYIEETTPEDFLGYLPEDSITVIIDNAVVGRNIPALLNKGVLINDANLQNFLNVIAPYLKGGNMFMEGVVIINRGAIKIDFPSGHMGFVYTTPLVVGKKHGVYEEANDTAYKGFLKDCTARGIKYAHLADIESKYARVQLLW